MKIKKLISLIAISFSVILTGCSLRDIFPKVNQPSIELEKTAITLNLADVDTSTYQLNPTIKNGEENVVYTFRYSTDNISVASVNPIGLITAKSVGKASIAVYLSNNAKIKKTVSVNVVNVPEILVKMDNNEASVVVGGTHLLSATVTNTDNQNVTWKSSNEEIATVDETGLVTISDTAVVGSKVIITATSIEDTSKFATCEITVSDVPDYKYDYTIMYYLCASTLEYDPSGKTKYEREAGCFSEDIKELLSLSIPSNIKLIVETGGTTKWLLPSRYLSNATSISSSALQRWEVNNNKLTLVETLDTNLMAHQDSFESFLSWGLNNYSAKQMGVVISGHGAGIGGCAIDDNYELDLGFDTWWNSLNAAEISTASKNALRMAKRDKFDWIGFDCCIMASADLASVLADSYDYMVASQETEYGYGWDHDGYLSKIVNNPEIAPKILLPEIAKVTVDQYDSSCCKYDLDFEPCYQTESVIDLSKMEEFTAAFNQYVEDIGTTRNVYTNYVCQAYKNSYNEFGGKYYGLADFKDFMKKMKSKISSVSIDSVIEALDKAIVANHYCEEYTVELCGLNVFVPYCVYGSSSFQVSKSDYSDSSATKFSGWQSMCLNYGSWSW